MKKKRCADPAWFRKIASELARRNTGKIDVSVAQTSEILGHLADHWIALDWIERAGLYAKLTDLGIKRLAASKARRRG